MPITTVVFDAYGTLFDVAAAARRAAAEPEFPELAGSWEALARNWRDKQLQYTWLRAITGYHADFRQVTADALDWAMEAGGLSGEALRTRLMDLYEELDAYPEVPGMLAALKEAGLKTAILANGTPGMLSRATESAGLGSLLDAVISVEDVGVYKPAAQVYALVGPRLDTRPDEVLFVSSNGWDVGSATAYGFRTLWVNRAGAPRDRIPDAPHMQAPDLSGVPDLINSPLAQPPVIHGAVQRFTNSDGLSLAYRDEGDGPPILCLCGLTRNMSDFDTVARDFSDRARIIRLDTRGRGQSDYDPHYLNYDLLHEGKDALDLLDHLGLEKTAILGTSRGGLIAMMLAVAQKARLTGVCLNDIGPVIEPVGLTFIMTYLGMEPPYQTLDEAADAFTKSYAKGFPGVSRALWRAHAERIWEETPDGLALRYDKKLRDSVIEQSATGEVTDLWPCFDAFEGLPLGLIRGATSDLLSAETAAEMQRRRPDMLYGEVPRRGHVPFLDEPEAVDLIARFIERLP